MSLPETSCNDNQDNDGDGDVDCADMDCLGTSSCPFSGEICNNGIDDDNNLATDCGDPACFGQTITVTDTNGVQWTGTCNASANLPETDCQDGIDNDGDFNYGGDPTVLIQTVQMMQAVSISNQKTVRWAQVMKMVTV